VIREDDADWWYVDGKRSNSFAGGAQAGSRFDHPESLRVAARFDEVRPGAYDPAAHLADNESDGVFGSVLYPTEGLLLYSVPDSSLLSAMCRVYNDWLAEFCRYDPTRLRGIAMLNVDDPAEAASELDRAAQAGLAGGLIPVALPSGRYYDDPAFSVLWRTAVELRMPLSLHIGTERASPDGGGFTDDLRSLRPATMVNQDHQLRNSLTDLILGGVFERWPDLRVGSVEHELGWAPFFVERLDYTYHQRARRAGWHRFADPAVSPSDYFKRNVFVSFQSDRLGITLREHFGPGMLLWGSDYPHTESTYPRSRAALEDLLAPLSADERDAVRCGNTVALYGFQLPAGQTLDRPG
jgi:predicted TIM-barrel fold metal-dependent hydrolase